MRLLRLGINALERGLVPDRATRAAIRQLCGQRLRELSSVDEALRDVRRRAFIEASRAAPIALVPEKANEQHYELPAEFFELVLGSQRKYSCCFWSSRSATLASAEEASLELTAQHALLADGQRILELGCGWGSLSLWMAAQFPHSCITAVSNSASQREYIQRQAERRGLRNLQVTTADMNVYAPLIVNGITEQFDRVVSVEMFEHMRNYQQLLKRIASWLRPGGSLFVHWFCHRDMPYAFETEGAGNWMGQHFFTGGIMPSVDLLRSFEQDLRVSRRWTWDGTHYQRTAEAWLANLDANELQVRKVLERIYGRALAKVWFHRWRVFFMAVAELFGYAGGQEWFVSHYVLERP